MSIEFSPLPIEKVTGIECVADYVYLPQIIHNDDPAIDCLIDFREIKPLSIYKNERMIIARQKMQAAKMDFIFVHNQDKVLVGILSLKQINSEQPIKAMESGRIALDEVLVNAVMTPIDHVHAVKFEKLKHAKVGHVVATLQQLQAYFILVINDKEIKEQKSIRGIFTITNIDRLTGCKTSIIPAHAKSVAELQQKRQH